MDGPYRSEHSPDTVLERVSDAVVSVNEQLECTYLNHSAQSILETTTGTVYDEPIDEYFPDPMATVIHEQIEQVRETGTSQSVGQYHERLGRWFEVSVYSDEDGFSIFLSDSADDKEGERAGHEVTTQFDQFSTAISEAFFAVSGDYSETVYVNPAVERMYGITPAEAREDPLAWLRHVHPDDRVELVTDLDTQKDDEVSWPIEQEFRIKHPDRGVRWVRTKLDNTGGADVIVGTARDITDSKQRERQLVRREHRLRATFDHAPDEMYVHDAEGVVQDVNLAAVDNLGYSRKQLLSMSVSDFVSDRSKDELTDVFQDMSTNSTYRTESRHERADGTTYPVEVWVNKISYNDTDRFVGICRDISTKRRQARALAELHSATQRLVEAKEQKDIIQGLVDAAVTIAGVDSATLYRFEESDNALLPADSHGRDTRGAHIEPGHGPRWDAFAEQTTRVLEPGNSIRVRDAISRVAVLSFGDRWLLQCASVEPDTFDEQRIELLETLTATTEAVLNRTVREQQLRRREEQLQNRSAEAERLKRVNERIRRLSADLADIRSREALNTVVCEGLTAIPEFEFAWIGTAIDDVVKPLATRGDHTSYLDTHAPIETGRSASVLPAGRAAATGDIVLVEQIADEIHEGEWQADALAGTLLSAVSVPVEHDGVRYGILTLYGNQIDAFGANVPTVLDEFADIVARTCRRIDQERAVQSGRERRVEFSATDVGTPLLSVADEFDSTISILRVDRSQPTTTVYVESTSAGQSACLHAGDATEGIAAVRATGPDTYCYQLEAEDGGLVREIAEHGGTVESITATAKTMRVHARFPDTGSTDAILRALSDRYDGLSVAQTHELDDTTHHTEQLFDELTDRQSEALRTAFQHGYFEWPRPSTGEEVAEAMGISPSTFTEHLRRAESTVLTRIIAYDTGSR